MAGIFENTVGLMLNIDLWFSDLHGRHQAVSNQTGTLAGFGDNTNGDFIMAPMTPRSHLRSDTSIGPITNSSVIDVGDPYETSQGELIFTSVAMRPLPAT